MQTATIRIAAIDPHTGYVWGEAIVLDPAYNPTTERAQVQTAAAQIMGEADGSRRYETHDFVEASRYDAARTLDLYEIADDEFELTDGQDRATIDAVCAGRLLGSVRYCPED